MRTSTAVAVVVLSGLTWIGVPSAAADELPPAPAEARAVSAPTDEPPPAATPEPSQEPTSVVTTPEPQETPTEEPAEPTSTDPTGVQGATGESTEPAQPTPPAEGSEGMQSVQEGELSKDAESGAPIGTPAADAVELPFSSQADAEPVLDPWASIGDLDCADLTIPVTLDNSRSTGTVAFVVLAAEDVNAEEVEALYEETFVLAAGAREVVRVPVADGIQVGIDVRAFDPSNVGLNEGMAFSFMRVICMVDEPRASIGDVDCSAFTVPVTLDNRRSLSETTFWVSSLRLLEDDEIFSQEPFAVQAGETRVVQIAVTQDDFLEVAVTLAEDYDAGDVLATEFTGIDCSPREGITTVTTSSIGDPDCRTRTFPVTIDNSDVAETRGVEVNAEWLPAAHFHSYLEWFYVAPEAIRVVRVPIPQSIDEMFVYVLPLEAQTSLDDGLLAERLMHMKCPSTAARPTVDVKGAKFPQAGGVTQLPQTGGFNFALPLLAVALLGTGGLLTLTGPAAGTSGPLPPTPGLRRAHDPRSRA